MKKFVCLLFVLALTVSTLAQTAVTSNTVTTKRIYTNPPVVGETGYPVLTGVLVSISFSSDSTLAQATAAFEVPEYAGVDPSVYPVWFREKQVSTFGTAAADIFVQGCFASQTDTLSIDTIKTYVGAGTAVQSKVDTIGTLNFNNFKAPFGYKVFIRDRTADINTGTLQLFFPVPVAGHLGKRG